LIRRLLKQRLFVLQTLLLLLLNLPGWLYNFLPISALHCFRVKFFEKVDGLVNHLANLALVLFVSG
jgi:hypothetical protein